MEKREFNKNSSLALKGIAIIMMMFHHCFWNVNLFENYNVSFSPLNQDLVVSISATFKICVSIFAFITGYGLTLSLKKLNFNDKWTKKEIIKWDITRLVKTLSGYWIIAILAYIICQLLSGMTSDVYFKNGMLIGIIQIIINFLGLSDLFGINNFNSAWWYMSIAILFILSVPLFVKLFKKYGYMPVLVTVIILPRILHWQYKASSYIAFLSPLIIGIIFAENDTIVKISNYKINKNVYINKFLKFVLGTLILVMAYMLYNKIDEKFWEIRFGIIPVYFICYLYEFILELPVIRKILRFLGKHSMNIFLVHEFIRTYYLTDLLYSLVDFWKIALVLLIASMVISIILEKFKKIIGYNKFIDWLLKIIDEKININKNGKLKEIQRNEVKDKERMAL